MSPVTAVLPKSEPDRTLECWGNCESSTSIEKLLSARWIRFPWQLHARKIRIIHRQKLICFIGKSAVVDMPTWTRSLRREIGCLLWVPMHPEIDPVSQRQKVEDKCIVDCIAKRCRDFPQELLNLCIIRDEILLKSCFMVCKRRDIC